MTCKTIDYIYCNDDPHTGELVYTIHYSTGRYAYRTEDRLTEAAIKFIQTHAPQDQKNGGIIYR